MLRIGSVLDLLMPIDHAKPFGIFLKMNKFPFHYIYTDNWGLKYEINLNLAMISSPY